MKSICKFAVKEKELLPAVFIQGTGWHVGNRIWNYLYSISTWKRWYMGFRIGNHLYSISAWNRMACGQQNSKLFVQHFDMEKDGIWATEFQIICTALLHCSISLHYKFINLNTSTEKDSNNEEKNGRNGETMTEWHEGNRVWNHLYSNSVTIYNNLIYTTMSTKLLQFTDGYYS